MANTYDPSKIGVPGKDRMRFEIGDTNTANAAISDEEIEAILAAYPNWATAKLKIVESIYRRFSYEVSVSVGGMSLQLQQRAEHWKKMYDELRKTGTSAPPIPEDKTGPYFYEGMMDNPAAWGR